MNEIIHCFSIQLISPTIIPSRSVHVVINGKDFFPFYGYIIFHGGVCVCVCVWCVYPIFFSHSFFDRHLSYFHVLSTINNGVVNMGVHITFQVFVSFGQLPSFLKNLHSVFYDGCTKFHSHQQCKKVGFFFFFPYTFQNFSVVLLIVAILISVR